MIRVWEERLSGLLAQTQALAGALSEACGAFEKASVLPDADDRETAVDSLDEAADCLTDAENCLMEALSILRQADKQ